MKKKKMKTLVIGASDNPERYSYLAINRLRKFGHEVEAIGLREGKKVADVTIQKDKPDLKDIDTVTLYLNPTNQIPYFNIIFFQHIFQFKVFSSRIKNNSSRF